MEGAVRYESLALSVDGKVRVSVWVQANGLVCSATDPQGSTPAQAAFEMSFGVEYRGTPPVAVDELQRRLEQIVARHQAAQLRRPAHPVVTTWALTQMREPTPVK